MISKNYQTGGLSNGFASAVAFRKDGRYLAFTSTATDLTSVVPNTLRTLYLRDMQTGVLKIVDVSAPGLPVTVQYSRFSRGWALCNLFRYWE